MKLKWKSRTGIDYHVVNAYSKDFPNEFPKEHLGTFDAILGFFLVDHAQTEIELQELARNLFACLKDGGEFMAMLDNPDAILPTDPKYGVAIEPYEDKDVGAQRKIVIYQNMKDGEDRPVLHFFNFKWPRTKIKEAFLAAGFTDLQFTEPFIAQEGEDRLGSEFWDDYRKDPGNVIFLCKK